MGDGVELTGLKVYYVMGMDVQYTQEEIIKTTNRIVNDITLLGRIFEFVNTSFNSGGRRSITKFE